MQIQTIDLLPDAPGARHQVQVLRFGKTSAGPKACIQAALHADEVPAMLVAQQLRLQLTALEAAGEMTGQVTLVPYANPIGLAQHLLGGTEGRFDLRDGVNFNRMHPELSDAVATAVGSQLGSDEVANVALIRGALLAAAAQLTATNTTQDLKNKLVQLAIDSDVVLDLHCDSQAVMHLYSLTPHAALASELGALLDAHAILLATESGGTPFDESCSRPWLLLQQRFPSCAVPLACFAATVELRGHADTAHDTATQDAAAIIEFLRRRGVVSGAHKPLPALRCEATPLAGSEPVASPTAGIVVFHNVPGDRVEAGAVIADVVDVETGAVTQLRCRSSGLLYARVATRWATPGKRLAKIAGTALARSGKLLSA